MDELFEAFCFLLDDEIERQETTLAVCIAQGDAARRNDLELLEAKTAALLKLLQETGESEKARAKVMSQLAAHYGLRDDQRNLRALCSVAPEKWRERLDDIRARLQYVLGRARPVVSTNASILRVALKVAGDVLRTLQLQEALGAEYDGAGALPTRSVLPRMIDQKG